MAPLVRLLYVLVVLTLLQPCIEVLAMVQLAVLNNSINVFVLLSDEGFEVRATAIDTEVELAGTTKRYQTSGLFPQPPVGFVLFAK